MAKTNNINWANFSITSPDFLKAQKKGTLSRLLHEYFSKNTYINLPFLEELAANYPSALICAIRTNRAYLNSAHFPSLHFLKSHSNVDLTNHYKVFAKLAELENELFQIFIHSLEKSAKVELLEAFTLVSLWFEKKRASLFASGAFPVITYDINSFVEAINFFLTYYLSENIEQLDSVQLTEHLDVKVLTDIAGNAKSESKLHEHPVWESLEKAYIYLYHLTGTIEIYSFDMNFDIVNENGVLYLKFIDGVKFKRWHFENEKIGYWYSHYRTLAEELVGWEQIKNPDFIKNKTGFDFEMNYEGAVRLNLARIVSEAFCIENSLLMDVPTSSLILFLQAFVANAWGRYVSPMDKLNSIAPQNWLQNILLNIVKFGSNEIYGGPLRMISSSEFGETVIENIENSTDYIQKLISLISIDPKSMKNVDRFNPAINLLGKPFIKIGDYYLGFNGVLGEANSQTNILVNVMESNSRLHSYVELEEVKVFEKSVKDMFKKAGFTNVDCSIKYKDGGIEGDFDIVVYEKGFMLLIELKRSKIRIHLSDAHNEYENNLLKASGQLDKAKVFIGRNFEKVKGDHFNKLNIAETEFTNITSYTMIVSTSFEYDHVLINDKHLKISLFELQNILENGVEMISENKLQSLFYAIVSNKYWMYMESDLQIPDINKWTLKIDS